MRILGESIRQPSDHEIYHLGGPEQIIGYDRNEPGLVDNVELEQTFELLAEVVRNWWLKKPNDSVRRPFPIRRHRHEEHLEAILRITEHVISQLLAVTGEKIHHIHRQC